MGLTLLTERHHHQIAGVISCYDRILIQGTLPGLCYAEGMISYLYSRQIRIFDYPRFAQPLRDQLRENAERLAVENSLSIEFIRRTKSFRKEEKVQQILRQRGSHPGLVCIFSAMEPCGSYQPWHNKQTGKTYLRPDDGKYLHYYFYHRRRPGVMLRARPHLVPFPVADLPQRASSLGPPSATAKGQARLARQRLRPDRGFRARSGDGRRLAGGATASAAGRVRPALLPRDRVVGRHLSLELGSSRVRQRSGVSSSGRLAGDLRHPHPHRHPHGETRQRGHFLGAKAASPLSGGSRQSLQYPHRRDADQTHNGVGLDQDVRQIRIDSPHRDLRQRCLLFSTLPHGRTAQRHPRHQVGGHEEEYL